MASENKNKSFMERLSAFIVDKKDIILLLYAGVLIFSLISRNWVKVCEDITQYLPSDTETRQGLTVMEDEFVTFATDRVMAVNITYDEAENLYEKIEQLPQVDMVTFDDSEDHYKNACALYDITLKYESGDEAVDEGYAAIRDLVKDYDTFISESDVDSSAMLDQEMSVILAIAAAVIVLVLLLTSKTYMEVPVLLITFVAGIILNKGSDFMLGEISFVSNSVTAILQLALSIDYAIIMIHHYSEERETLGKRESVIQALAKSIPEISSSSLTTVSGMMALMFMQFKLGFDLGLCLIKAILFSLLSVFTLMPCLLMIFGKYIDKTHHKSLLPDMSWLGSLAYKVRMVVPPIFVVMLIAGFFCASNCPYVYDSGSSATSKKNETQIAQETIEEYFGKQNIAALVIPAGDYDKEKQLAAELEQYDDVKSVTALSNIEAKDGYMLTDKLTPRQFSELTDIDIETSKLIYTLYAADNEDYSKLITNMNDFSVPILDMFRFVYDLKRDGYVHFDDELNDKLDDMNIQLETASKQLSGDKYSRMLIELNLPKEGDETFNFIDTVHRVAGRYYDDFYFVGDSTSCYDLANSFKTDNILVSVLSVLFVIIVLFFTFKNAGLPVLLILVIQGSVWFNFGVSYITNSNIYFLAYLIVSSIQMGANIDYAIVISSRYMELKKRMNIKNAIRGALSFAFPTVLTSGSILSAAGFLISVLSTDPTIVAIGTTVCRGTLISMFLVLFVLPAILLLCDVIVEKSHVKMKELAPARQETTGRFLVNGRVRGRISGYVDADIHGVVRGDIDAMVNINNISKETEGDEGNEYNGDEENSENA